MTNQKSLIEFDKKLDKLCNGMDIMKEKQDQMAEDIVKIKEAVYNPDEGLYARLRELETWKASSSKMIWTLFTAVIGLISALVLKSF
tara:strand:+ start:3177 stop:3437 length:261 start_codon:yes stop_codon:yes gene_type:complete